jgi:hypothetical protein
VRLFRPRIFTLCHTPRIVTLQQPAPAEESDNVSMEEQIAIPDWHRKILDERIAKYAADGFQGITLDEFEKELENS